MDEPNLTPKLPDVPKPPAEPEQPEAGFVPYCAEAADEKPKRNWKLVLLIILLILVIIGFCFTLFSRKLNFYSRTLSALNFDYRNGESSAVQDETGDGHYAGNLSQQCKNHQVDLKAVEYTFDESRNISKTLTRYDYSYNVNEVVSEAKIGTANWFLTQKQGYRYSKANGLETGNGDKWEPASEGYIPALFTYCFATESNAVESFRWRDTYQTEVNGIQYNCEIWLLCDTGSGSPVYLTLYRYYNGERLAGVRVLSNTDDFMTVYDIQEYTIS